MLNFVQKKWFSTNCTFHIEKKREADFEHGFFKRVHLIQS